MRNVSGTPSILKDFMKEGKEVVKTISNANETEFSILRKTSSTTLNPFSVKPIF
jgi:hypothetical protein